VEVQKWDKGNERERDVTVYSFNYDNPEIKDRLIQAVKDAGFYQVWTGEYSRDWDLPRGVLRWCIPADTEKEDRQIQVSAVGETTVHTYFFKPIPDSGVYWTAVEDSPFSSGSDDEISDIAYGGGTFVAVGIYKEGSNWKGEMAYSADGVTWTKVTDTKFGSATAIVYGNGKFVASGVDGKVAYSADGVTWTTGDSTFSGTIAYGGGKFIVGGGYHDGRRWHCGMSYSGDGVTWTAVKDSAFGSGGDISAIAYGGGRFVAGGNEDGTRSWVPAMAYSNDGVTWTKVKYIYSTPSSGIRGIAYGDGKFVAVGGKGQMAYSADGITWTAVTDSTLDEYLGTIVYVGGRFVAVSYNGKTAYSADGVTWTAGEDINLGSAVEALSYGGGRFVVVGWESKIAYSNVQE
jgi:hypothetical protein